MSQWIKEMLYTLKIKYIIFSSESSRLMQLSHTPPLSSNQTSRGEMPSDARPSSDEDEGYSGTRSSSFVRSHVTSEPGRSPGLHSRPVQSGPICSTPGTTWLFTNDKHNLSISSTYCVPLSHCSCEYVDLFIQISRILLDVPQFAPFFSCMHCDSSGLELCLSIHWPDFFCAFLWTYHNQTCIHVYYIFTYPQILIE